MKRLRSWAWPDPMAVSRRVNAASFGSGFWKRVYSRKQREVLARRMAQQLAHPAFVVVRATADETEAPAAAPVVH